MIVSTALHSVLEKHQLFKKICVLILEMKREREKHRCERQTSIACLPYAPWRGIKTQPKSVPWPGNQTCNLLVYGMMLQPTEPPSQGKRHPLFFKRFYLFIFRQTGREGEREGEKHQYVVASRAPPAGDLAHNPGMCPDWESNWRLFGSQAGAQSTGPHQPGQDTHF